MAGQVANAPVSDEGLLACEPGDERLSGVYYRGDSIMETDAFPKSEAPTSSRVEAKTDVRRLVDRPRSMAAVMGGSAELVELFRIVDRVADSRCTVLVTGESGTGKELVARGLHDASSRSGKPFVAVNCGAIPEALLESELFGHARGAFTGAHAAKIGRIGTASGGTLFLDEVGELPLALQVKLLRVLQSGEYSPIGDNKTYKADVRVVAATNVNLEEAVASGSFREDLFYRLNVIHLQVPALRDRKDDVILLADHFLQQASARLDRAGVAFAPATIDLLVNYHWPGNVRELENTIERAVLLCGDERIEPKDLPARVCGIPTEKRGGQDLPSSGVNLRTAVEAFENNLIRQALERTGWNKNQAARLLGLNRTTLVEMLKRKRMESKVA